MAGGSEGVEGELEEKVSISTKNESENPEEKVCQEFVSLHNIKFLFIRFFSYIRWALCSLATGILTGLAAAWQQATWQEWNTVATAIHHLERGGIKKFQT